MALRIGVVSDTHIRERGGPLPAALLAALEGVDAILHAGDIVCRAVLETLAAMAPVHAVYGNVDPPDLQDALPSRLLVRYGGVRIGITHGHLGAGSNTPARALGQFQDEQVDVVVFGHSHVPLRKTRGGVLLFNPGSPTQPRRMPRPTYGMLTIEDGRLSATIARLAR